MTNPHKDRQAAFWRVELWLATPISRRSCVLGWCAATTLFLAIVGVLGGPSLTDTPQSVYGTWAIAHGDIHCAYPAASFERYSPIAPTYLLLSGAIAAATGIGHTVAFPPAGALGASCDGAFVAMNRWAGDAGALRPTTWIGCIGWLVLMAGVVAWLRSSGRGRQRWEPVTLLVLACLPTVWACVQVTFHPEDLLAIGFALAAMACACRGRWKCGGIFIALAVLSQPFALLVAAPLLLVAPANRKISYAAAAVTTTALIDIPLLAATAGHALRAITLGTGDKPDMGGTVLWELHLHGAPLLLLSRVSPVAASVGLSWWVARRLGPKVLRPTTLFSLVAVSLSLRLVFEVNLYEYYFMALAVALVLLDVTRGYIRSSTIAWLGAVTLVFCLLRGLSFESIGLGGYVTSLQPLLFLAPAIAMMVVLVHRGGGTRNLLPWLGVALCALLTWPGHSPPYGFYSVAWLWQIVLVGSGIMIAAGPLLSEVRRAERALHPNGADNPAQRQGGVVASW